ncbi:hypothetical protein CEXT_433631 [Caerostris extrusa]|uniref:Uncharacterized protein n=1 Tax=Caerostris extrusa TaxID=172846 RepID=A0AAV4TNQ6_CAEEX|nr:hypothetical protein CEXT_433631 [Caerostris extrusa]
MTKSHKPVVITDLLYHYYERGISDMDNKPILSIYSKFDEPLLFKKILLWMLNSTIRNMALNIGFIESLPTFLGINKILSKLYKDSLGVL